jgi:transcriptional regulator with XRE-family HTH domain
MERSVNPKEFRRAMIEADYDTFVSLSAASGIDQASLSCIARGERKPSWETIAAISEALHLTYDAIGRVFFYSKVTDT